MKNRLLLFVHGLGGAGQATWRDGGRPGFAELISGDGALRDSADVAFFEYPTSLFRLPLTQIAPKIGTLALGLRGYVDARFPDHKSIALICHSLGGLVARKYLIEEVRAGKPLRVDKLLLFAVPNNGNRLAEIAKYVSWRHNQLAQLCRDSKWLQELNEDWSRMNMNDHVEVRHVFGGQDRVVDEESAVGQWGNKNVDPILDASHVSIVKPRVHTDLSYVYFRRFVLGPVPVFLSVGGGRTEHQEVFVKAIKDFFLSKGLEAMTVEKYATNLQPLKDVEYRMNQCYGAVVLAFERTRIGVGVSRPGAGAKLEHELKNVRLPPIWNQIEAAMAYTRGLPLLVLVEDGLQDEGMLESRYDWRVKRINLQDSIVGDPEFLGMFEAWRGNVLAKRDTPSGALRQL